MRTEKIEEYNIEPTTNQAIQVLLTESFSAYPKDRTYFKQAPTFRMLHWDGKKLIGHLAVNYRILNIGGSKVPVFGISDFCVSEEYRSKKIGTTLINSLEEKASKLNIQFLILIAEDHSIYKKNGFRLVNNTCRWLLINEHQSLGVMHGNIEKSILIKSIGNTKWNKGIVDFLGPVF